MKNKLLFTILFVLISCAFVITSSATCFHNDKEVISVSYQDYTKDGTEEFACPDCSQTTRAIEPLVTFLGNSISEKHNGICEGYLINHTALAQLKKQNESFELGAIAASVDALNGKMPLDSKTAEPVNLSEQGATVVKKILPEGEYFSIEMIVKGLNFETFNKNLYLCAYVYDGNEVFYLQSAQTKDTICATSFFNIKGDTETTIEDMTYTLTEETELSADRLKQMAKSESSYATGSQKTSSELDSIETSAKIIIAGGEIFGYKKATGFLSYYLSNSGEQFSLNMNTFLKDEVALANRNSHINLMLRAAEQLAISNASISINQAQERINHNLTGDWKYSLGSYFDDVDITNLTVKEKDGVKTYTATVKYMVIDFYNWNEYSTSGFLNGMGPSQNELYQLHLAGRAKEFLTYGEITYEITWTEGQTVDQIRGFN